MSTAIHIELNALCIIMLYAIAHQTLVSVNQQMRRVLFRNLVYGIIIQLALDSLWLLVEGRSFPGAVFANRVINALYLADGVILGCIWYLYVLESMGYTITRKLQNTMMIPGLVFLALNIISIWTGWIFVVSEDNVYSHGPLFWLQMIGAYGMIVVSLIHLIVRLIHEKDPSVRETVKSLLSFFFLPIVGTIVAMFQTGMPGTWTCGAVSIVLIYLNDQDREIVRDGLTGLNNRKTLESAFTEYSRQAGAQNPLYLFMMDLDRFKQINDTYGHPVGDQTLVAAGKILTSCMVGHRGILIRYGGDEFLVMGFFADDDAANAFKQKIIQKFAEYWEEHRPPYRFAMSVGFSRYQPGQKLESLVDAADDELYREKQRTNAGR